MDVRIDPAREVEKWLNYRPEKVTVHEMVDDFFAVNRGDVVVLDNRYYVISGIARERSFGLDEEPKYWVRYAYEIPSGKRKVIKMVYLEQFDLRYGDYVVRCFRSPSKEARALDAVKGNPYFMHGHTVSAVRGKQTRVIDYITGRTLLDKIEDADCSHERYFTSHFPALLRLFLPCLTALDFLHGAGIRHGDVRSDHLILDKDTGCLRWIDLDYDFIFTESPYALDLLGIGNVLSELVGKGERTIHNLRRNPSLAGALESLCPEDFSVVERTRLMNWRKVYPYIPKKLNRVLMHFAAGAEVHYESAAEIADDLGDALESIT